MAHGAWPLGAGLALLGFRVPDHRGACGCEQKREFKLVLEGDKEAGIEKLFEQILGPTAGPEAADAPAEAVRPAKEKKKPKNIIATHLTIRYEDHYTYHTYRPSGGGLA